MAADMAVPGLARLAGRGADGSRVWVVDGETYDDDALEKLIGRQHLLAESEALVGRELGETLGGRDVQARADEILRARGIQPDDATEQQLLDALRRVSR